MGILNLLWQNLKVTAQLEEKENYTSNERGAAPEIFGTKRIPPEKLAIAIACCSTTTYVECSVAVVGM